MIQAILRVSGRVQGVGYRYFCKNLAEKHGLFGYAMNESDGSVRVLVQGSSSSVNSFVLELREKAPFLARVDSIDVEEKRELPVGEKVFSCFLIK